MSLKSKGVLYLHGSWFSWENNKLGISVRGKLQVAVGRILAKDFDLIVLNTGMIWGESSGSYAQVFREELVAQGVDPQKILILENGHPKSLDTSIEIESLLSAMNAHPEWKEVAGVAFEEHLRTIKLIYLKLGLPTEKVELRSTESIINSQGTAADKKLLSQIKNSLEEKMFHRYQNLNVFFISLLGARFLRNFAKGRNKPGSGIPWFLRFLFPGDIDIYQLPPK